MHLGALGQMQSHEIGGWWQVRGVEEGLGGRPHVDRLDAADAQAARIHGRQRRAPQDVEGECAVVERARQRADVIERRREWPQPVGRHAAECGLEARHAAGRGRQADRRTGVGAEPECAQAGCERTRVAARRPARDAVGPGAVDDCAIGAIARRHAPRELVQIRLAQHDGARVEQPPDTRGRAHGDVVTEDPRAVGRAHACGVEDVLHEQRHACQRPLRPVARAHERSLRGERDDRVQVLVLGDAVQVVTGDLACRELARADRGGDATGGPGVEGVHLRAHDTERVLLSSVNIATGPTELRSGGRTIRSGIGKQPAGRPRRGRPPRPRGRPDRVQEASRRARSGRLRLRRERLRLVGGASRPRARAGDLR